jgi:hypothetical protein
VLQRSFFWFATSTCISIFVISGEGSMPCLLNIPTITSCAKVAGEANEVPVASIEFSLKKVKRDVEAKSGIPSPLTSKMPDILPGAFT